MISLAVSGLDAQRTSAVAARLRDVTLIAVSEGDAADIDADGIVLLEPTATLDQSVDRWLQAGRRVWVSQSACDSAAQFSAWERSARATDGLLSIGEVDLHLPSIRLIRQQLDAGKLGAPGLIRSHHWKPPSETGSVAAQLRMLVHTELRLAIEFMGAAPNCVFALATAESSQGADRQIHLGFPHGGMALITVSQRVPPGDAYRSFSLIGSSGAAYQDDHPNRQLLFRGGRAAAVPSSEGGCAHAAMLQEFADQIGTPRKADDSIRRFRDVLNVADAVEESIRTRSAWRPE